jgi:predicted PurR-regulated permease PerM
VTKLLDRFGLTNLATVQQKLADRGSLFLASQAIIIGQTTFEVIIKLFVMPYLLFFLLRDGEAAPRRADLLIPGSPSGARLFGRDTAWGRTLEVSRAAAKEADKEDGSLAFAFAVTAG